MRSSELCTSATGPEAPILKAITVDPGVVEATLTARQFPFPVRVATTTRVPRTNATEGVPFALSASWPSAAFRATISACAVPAAKNAPAQATAAITMPRPMAGSYAVAEPANFKIPQRASRRRRDPSMAPRGRSRASPERSPLGTATARRGQGAKPQIKKGARGETWFPPRTARSRVPPSRRVPGRNSRRLLGPGLTAAPGRQSLALLPSGPDAVRMLPVRGTWPSTLRARAQAPKTPPLGRYSAPLERITGSGNR